MRRRGFAHLARLACLAGASLLLVVPAQAVAGHHHGHSGCGHRVPGGNSQIGQYTEPGTVPGSCGNQTVNPGQPGSGHAIPSSTASQLESLGPAGVAAAQLASATAPPGSGSGAGGASDAGGQGSGTGGAGSHGNGVGAGAGAASIAATASGASLPGQIATTLTGSSVGDSMGFFLPLIIVAAAIAGIAYALVRRRSSVG